MIGRQMTELASHRYMKMRDTQKSLASWTLHSLGWGEDNKMFRVSWWESVQRECRECQVLWRAVRVL